MASELLLIVFGRIPTGGAASSRWFPVKTPVVVILSYALCQVQDLAARVLRVTLARHLHRDLGLKAAEITTITADGMKLEEGDSLADAFPQGLGGVALGVQCKVPEGAAKKPPRKRR